MGTISENVTVLINGTPFTGWTAVTVEQSFDKATGHGTLKITEQPSDPFPVSLGAKACIICGGRPVLTGHVFSIDAVHDAKSGGGNHDITLSLRDSTQDLIDSTIGPKQNYKPPISLKEVATGTLGKMGIPIGVIDKANPEQYGPAEVLSGDIVEKGQQWLDRWAEKRQTVLNTDGKGNLVIDRNMMRSGPGMLFKSFEDHPLNNVLKAQYKNSEQDRHNQQAVSAQKSTNDKKHWESQSKGVAEGQSDPLQKHWGVDNDTAIRGSRRKHSRAQRGLNAGSPKKAAKWRSNVAKARGFQYIATVQGFDAAPGVVWWHGYIIPVRDDHFQLSDELFITGVKFHKDVKSGSHTEVICTYKDAFSDQSGGGGGGRTAKSGLGNSSEGSYPAADASDLE